MVAALAKEEALEILVLLLAVAFTETTLVAFKLALAEELTMEVALAEMFTKEVEFAEELAAT
jgi:hypothetical protein